MNLNNILNDPALAGMRAVNQWLIYRVSQSAKRPGKLDKIPLHYATCQPTSVTAAESWTDVTTAVSVASVLGDTYGVGFCFTPNCGFWFLDLDSCLLGPGLWSPLAVRMVTQALPGAAVEVSVSGKGLHLFGSGRVPPHSNRNAEHHAELYTADRFCALSGDSLQGDCSVDLTERISWVASTYFPARAAAAGGVVPDTGPRADWRGPTDDADLLRRALQSHSARSTFGGGASFADLWTADERVLAGAFPPDNQHDPFNRSDADAALLAHLAFWTGCDRERMRRLLPKSALAREKHDRDDYLERTIDFVATNQREVLQDKPIEPLATAAPSTTPPAMTTVDGNTFLNAVDQAALFAGCVYVVDAHRVLTPTGVMLKPDQFRAKYGGYTFAMDARNERTSKDAFEAFTQSQVLRAPKVDGTCFRPGLPYGAIVTAGGRTRANTWVPAEVARCKGDATPFLDHLHKLLPVPGDFEIALAYMAFCVQYPGVKAPWALVLQGVEGNGKTLLSRCLARALGSQYVHWPKASKIAAQFNSWLVGKLLYCVEDIYTDRKVNVLEELKPMIAGGDELEIEAKGVDQVSAEICGNFIINTNHPDGILKTRNDRRFCWLACDQQTVDDLVRCGMPEAYHVALHRWLNHEDGYAIVAEFLATYAIPDRLNPARGCTRAPKTSTTEAAIAQSLGDAEHEIVNAIDEGLPGFRGGWISSAMIDRTLKAERVDTRLPRKARGAFIRSLGYVTHPGLPKGQTDNVVLPDGKKPVLYVKPGHQTVGLTVRVEIARAYEAAQRDPE
ncbi:DUF5906 domain-containing protein [Ideonella sp. A 288]|uniref:phage NrS-1 polymerase family protein n=1 Tax=Ideonella sp. A 288 TaxID=1962181 RepID=UPI0011868651|nr:DUF5906 domain-containing protein [Ideonella sp. A 288]